MFTRKLPAFAVATALLMFAAPASAQEPRVSFNALVTAGDPATSDGKPSAGPAQFAWPGDQQLAAVLTLKLSGYEGQRKVELHAALFEEKGQDSRDEHPLAKLDGEYQLAGGTQRIAFPKLWHSAELPGRRSFRLELEAALDGADEARASLHFAVTGPPPPTLKLLSFEVHNPALEPQQPQIWQPSQRVLLNAVFSVSSNQARRGPQLALFGLMDEDQRDVSADTADRWQGVCWDTRQLPPEDGTYQLTLRGVLPAHYLNEYDSAHPFTFQLVLDSGAGKPLRATAVGSVTDYTPGVTRRSREVEPRLIQLDRAQQWDLRRIGEPQE